LCEHRPVVAVAAEDDTAGVESVAPEVARHAAATKLPLTTHDHGHLGDAQLLEGEVEEDLLGVGESPDRIQAQRRAAAVAAHPAGNVVEVLAREPRDEPRHHPVAPELHEGHPGDQRGVRKARGAGEVGAAAAHWLDQGGDVGGVELAVRVDAHDQIGTDVDAVAQGGRKGGADAPRRLVADHLRTGRLGRGAGAVAAAVVHHQHGHAGHTGQFLRDSADHRRDGLLLVEGRDHHQQRESLRGPRGGGTGRFCGGRHGGQVSPGKAFSASGAGPRRSPRA
jgi:hypothetical protein